MNKLQIFLLLLLITCIGGLFRFYLLGTVPTGLHRDEAFFGYNAYSLMVTGKDMTGYYLPIHISSFLNSPALYSYLVIPFIKIFDLTALSVRFPSAVFGTFTIPLLFILCRQLFKKEKWKEIVGLLAAFSLAISPWHINLSRVATENIPTTFFLLLGLMSFLHFVTTKSHRYLFTSFAFFFITLFLYQAPRAFLPLYIPLLFYVYKKELSKKDILLGIGLFSILIIFPVVFVLLSPTLSERMQMLSITSDPGVQLVIDESLREDGVSGIDIISARIFHNKIFTYLFTASSNYFSYFSFDFLLGKEYLPMRYAVPNMGLLYIYEVILILFGSAMILIKKNYKVAAIILGWIILTPLGSSLTYDDIPNMQRIVFVTPMFAILASVGLVLAYQMSLRTVCKKIVVVGLIGLVLYSLSYFSHQYFIHSLIHKPWYRQDGYKDLMVYLNQWSGTNQQIVMSESESAPFIFLFFFNKVNPLVIQREFAKNGNSYEEKVGNISFTSVHCPLTIESIKEAERNDKLNMLEGIIYVNMGDCPKIPEHSVILKQIKRNDDSTIFTVLKYTK